MITIASGKTMNWKKTPEVTDGFSGSAATLAAPTVLAVSVPVPGTVVASTGFTGGAGSTICGPFTSDVEEVLRDRDEILEVERPAEHHLDRQSSHAEEQHDEHIVSDEAHLLGHSPEDRLRE